MGRPRPTCESSSATASRTSSRPGAGCGSTASRLAEAFRDFFKASYGPTIAVYRANAADPERCAALDRDLDALADRYGAAGGVMEWEYLLFTARRR